MACTPTATIGNNLDKVRPATPAGPEPKPEYSGKLHGVPGTFVCGNPRHPRRCQIQLTPGRYGGAVGT